MATGNTDFIYRNKLDKACFQHDMAFGKSKDLVKRTQSNKVLRDKTFKIASDPRYDGYQRGLASLVYNFLIKGLVEVVLVLPNKLSACKQTPQAEYYKILKKKSLFIIQRQYLGH